MNTIRSSARVPGARIPSAISRIEAESRVIEGWEGDILRASRASARSRWLNSTRSLSDDVAQDVRFAVWIAFRRTGIDDQRYLRRVISNSAKNSARQTQVAANEVSIDSQVLPPLQPVLRDVLAERRVRRWIGTLPPQLRSVFHLLYRKDLSQGEAALHLGVSQPRVSQLHRQLLDRGADVLRDLAV